MENVQYLLIGGWAVNRYVEPRFTGDIDFFVSSSKDNELKMRKVLKAFGYADVLPEENRTLFLKDVVMLGNPPFRIDIISKVDGITFEEAWENRDYGNFGGIQIPFISINDLIKNKESTGRDKDILDAKNLRKYNS